MAFKHKTEIIEIFRKNIPIQAIYKGGATLWQAVRSCFGSGGWFNTKPWLNDEAWKNE